MNKKLTLKRIIIYTLLSFSITAIWYIVFNNILSGNRYMYDNVDKINPFNQFSGFSMFGPAIAVFITRAVTKEGMENSMLKFNIKGNVKYYAMAIWVLIIFSAVTALAAPIITASDYIITSEKLQEIFLYLLNTISMSCIAIGMYFGEEYGWRGYLYPKLEEIMGTAKAVTVSGIIWGVWHTPMLLNGHNFGRDIAFFPVSNIILMCIFCICIAAFFTYISKKANSVWPAAIAHAFFNNFAGISRTFFIDENVLKNCSQIQKIAGMFIPLILMGIVFYIIIIKDEKLHNN